MTPQQRHMDQARKILSMLVPFSEWCPPWEKAVNELATAIAAAENRAAWDGREFGSRETGHHLCGSPAECAEVYREFIAKYGPRPTKENQP